MRISIKLQCPIENLYFNSNTALENEPAWLPYKEIMAYILVRMCPRNLVPIYFISQIYFFAAKISLIAAPLNQIMKQIIGIEWGLTVNQIHSCLQQG